jgi:hypothetical protein
MNPAKANRSATAMAAAFILPAVGSTVVNFYARLVQPRKACGSTTRALLQCAPKSWRTPRCKTVTIQAAKDNLIVTKLRSWNT